MTTLHFHAEAQESIATHTAAVRQRIQAACERAQRDPSTVRLVAITKTLSIARIRQAYAAGLRDFGENRIEEAREKLPQLRQELPDARWHMVGHVQSRKAAALSPLFDELHSLDSLRLAHRLGRFLSEREQKLPVLIQCNVSGETHKSGFPASTWREQSQTYEELSAAFREILNLPGLELRGLMTMAPYSTQAEASRPHFASLAALRDSLQERLSHSLPVLSMGMTNDYEVAIEEGATLVRIGRALFGERPTQ
ncbi:MAG: YggS family pyridoxal phosphate-dependent enzyme [Anaerolineaceae bacterium]|nr:YggS family pyridoxal phosphate-dependent enzyme [Anaerolineaceae bacterium]